MPALIIADTEFPLADVPTTSFDVLLSCGDLPDGFILRVAAHCSCKGIFAVRGNHDTAAPFPAPILDLHLRARQFGGMSFAGFAGCVRYKPRGHYLYEQEEVESSLASFPAVDVFVTHNSPLGIHDDPHDEAHEGFRAFGGYVERCRPRFLLHGHQHTNRQTLAGRSWVVGVYGWRSLDLSAALDNP